MPRRSRRERPLSDLVAERAAEVVERMTQEQASMLLSPPPGLNIPRRSGRSAALRQIDEYVARLRAQGLAEPARWSMPPGAPLPRTIRDSESDGIEMRMRFWANPPPRPVNATFTIDGVTLPVSRGNVDAFNAIEHRVSAWVTADRNLRGADF